MQGVHAIWQHIIEANPFHREGITIQPKDVFGIYRADRLFKSLVENWKAIMLGVARFVDGIVPS